MMKSFVLLLVSLAQAAAISCPAGSTISTGSTSCSLCPVGTYSGLVGRTGNCPSCPQGSTTSSTGSILVADCSVPLAGYYNNGSGVTTCTLGTYSSSSGGASCTSCPAGSTTQTSGNTASSSCTKALAGYTSINGSVSICMAGTYSNGAGRTTACPSCAAGSYSSAGSSYCSSCSAGSYSSAGSSSCTACTAGSTTPATAGPFTSQASCTIALAGYSITTAGIPTACVAGSKFSLGGPAPVTCSACATPSSSQYVTSTCTTSSDTVLASATTSCSAGYYMSTLYVAGNPSTLGTNGFCKPCSSPAANQWVSSTCTASADTGLASITACAGATPVTFTAAVRGNAQVLGKDAVCYGAPPSPPLPSPPPTPSPPPSPSPPVTAVASLGSGIDTGFCVTVSGKWNRGSPGEGQWQTLFDVDGLHGEIFSWGGDEALWRNHSELRLTNHNHNSLHCVYTAFLVSSKTDLYGSWPAGVDKTIRFCAKPSGIPMLPFDVTNDLPFEHMKFSITRPASFTPSCRPISLSKDTSVFLGHSEIYKEDEVANFLDYGNSVSVSVTHSNFYGCLHNMQLHAIGDIQTAPHTSSLDSSVSFSYLTDTLPATC